MSDYVASDEPPLDEGDLALLIALYAPYLRLHEDDDGPLTGRVRTPRKPARPDARPVDMPKPDEGPRCTRCGERTELSILNFTESRVESVVLKSSGAPAWEYEVPPSVAYLCHACGHQGGVNVGRNWRP